MPHLPLFSRQLTSPLYQLEKTLSTEARQTLWLKFTRSPTTRTTITLPTFSPPLLHRLTSPVPATSFGRSWVRLPTQGTMHTVNSASSESSSTVDNRPRRPSSSGLPPSPTVHPSRSSSHSPYRSVTLFTSSPSSSLLCVITATPVSTFNFVFPENFPQRPIFFRHF